jgi:hypothetical protein
MMRRGGEGEEVGRSCAHRCDQHEEKMRMESGTMSTGSALDEI